MKHKTQARVASWPAPDPATRVVLDAGGNSPQPPRSSAARSSRKADHRTPPQPSPIFEAPRRTGHRDRTGDQGRPRHCCRTAAQADVAALRRRPSVVDRADQRGAGRAAARVRHGVPKSHVDRRDVADDRAELDDPVRSSIAGSGSARCRGHPGRCERSLHCSFGRRDHCYRQSRARLGSSSSRGMQWIGRQSGCGRPPLGSLALAGLDV